MILNIEIIIYRTMLQKNSFLNIFTSCYSSQKQQNELFTTPSKVRGYKNKPEPKISLKKGRHQSFQQVKMLDTNTQIKTKQNLGKAIRDPSIKDNRISEGGHFAYLASNKNKWNHADKQNNLAYKACEFTPTKKFVPYKMQIESQKPSKQLELQKTTKNISLNGKEHFLNEPYIKKEGSELQEIKQINKERFISNLENYKESLVSINFESGAVQPHLEQSRIEVNFFNPTTSKIAQFQRYLHDRK